MMKKRFVENPGTFRISLSFISWTVFKIYSDTQNIGKNYFEEKNS